MLRSFVVGLVFLSVSSARAQALRCFDAAKWINACVDRVQKGDEMKSTLVDVRFPGEKESPISDNWVLKNFNSLNEGGFSFDEDARTTQDACKSLTTKESKFDIVASSATHLDMTFSPDTFLKDKSGLEVVILSTVLANLKVKMQEVAGKPESLRITIAQVSDNQPVESDYIIRCGGENPEKEKLSPSVEALKVRHDRLVAAGLKPTEEKDERPLAFITKKGRMIFSEKNDDEAKQEYKDAFDKYVLDKGKVAKNLEVEDSIKVQAEFLKEKGKDLSAEARMSAFHELTFARLILNPKDEEQLIKDNPDLKGKLKELRAHLLENQKLIAAQLDLPDGYWNYPDVPNDVLGDLGKAIGEALGDALEEMAEDVAKGLKKAIEQQLPVPPPGQQQML